MKIKVKKKPESRSALYNYFYENITVGKIGLTYYDIIFSYTIKTFLKYIKQKKVTCHFLLIMDGKIFTTKNVTKITYKLLTVKCNEIITIGLLKK